MHVFAHTCERTYTHTCILCLYMCRLCLKETQETSTSGFPQESCGVFMQILFGICMYMYYICTYTPRSFACIMFSSNNNKLVSGEKEMAVISQFLLYPFSLNTILKSYFVTSCSGTPIKTHSSHVMWVIKKKTGFRAAFWACSLETHCEDYLDLMLASFRVIWTSVRTLRFSVLFSWQ